MASEKTMKFIEDIKALTVLELAELVDAIQEEFGVTAAVAAAPAAGGAAAGAAEKTEFDVVMTSFGDSKMNVIKVIKDVMGLGLKESKEFVEGLPKAVKEGASKADAEDIKAKLEAAGATIEIK
ncbi:MAG: 50S ribosomal protein L7/L12 [Oscillospiraceae bacterium]|jgi:large subunit ribosomal protein L7/L12|uniref:50S ribosomal protein L7/L12 n=1 Tax=Ruminococcus sp. HUN007 TaxID=1514668 RepID=UPI0005D21187|nr:50S ribosomal protein L7/L12 [Ruminococcus sp. HUN007]MBP0978321.1 50S ribosomal protein L7/L12 [Oscillospiraceae bacterium]MBP1568492.1 50S ribosomal protein L7/L12 [Oscillospiraceae bacterium]MBP1592582.1 50S ribosomal protein L7/L12 [Oscillospiraceae bacterium]MBQ5336183.1 50S ribosomal protein L7/L12 [Oscillospiraceae bacterium]MBQ5988205.1 50S ribosomal protein L7/L12 [Oscillospiraceae bacterium]